VSFFVVESLSFKRIKTSIKVIDKKAAIKNKDDLKPINVNNRDPNRKPNPLTAFFEPVIKETHWNNLLLLSGASNLTELLELILVRSLAIPDNP
jgi:hypothetical protein